MLSGNDNIMAGGQLVSSVSGGAFAHISSVRRLGINQGKLFRKLLSQAAFACRDGCFSLYEYADEVCSGVVAKFSDIATGGKRTWRSDVAYAASSVLTGVAVFFVFVKFAVLAINALFWASLAVVGMFILHNLVHTALLGMAHLGTEIAATWERFLSNPMQHIREDAGAFERGFMTVLHRIAQYTLAAASVVPSVLTAALSVPLSPLYMLLNAAFPKLDLEEDRATKKILLEMARERVPDVIDSSIEWAIDFLVSGPAFHTRSLSLESLEYCAVREAVDAVVLRVQDLNLLLSNRIFNIKSEFSYRMNEQNLSTDREVKAALAHISECDDNGRDFKLMGTEMYARMLKSAETKPLSQKEKIAVRILELIKDSPCDFTSVGGMESFKAHATSTLHDELVEEASVVNRVPTNIKEAFVEPMRSCAILARAG